MMVSAIPVSPMHRTICRVERQLYDALAKGQTIEPSLMLKAQRLLEDHLIERHATPSPCPGVSRPGSHGASPAQMDIVRAFRYGRHDPIPEDSDDDPARQLRQLRQSKFDLIFAGGANRSGKTVSVWGMCFCQHIRDHAEDGDLFWAVAPDFTKLRQGPHKWLWQYLPRSMFGDRSYSERLGFGTNPILELTLPRGRGKATVVFKTEEQKLESFESDSVAGIAWTEATRESIYDAIIARVIDTDGFILVDYLRDEAWHNERFENDPHAFYRQFAMKDNAHNLPPGAIDKARRTMSKDEAAVRIDGKNRAAFGVVIKEFRPEPYHRGDEESGHLVRPFAIPKHWPVWVFTDVGKYTASLLLTVGPDSRWYVVDEAYTIGEQYDEHAKAIDSMLARNGRTRDDVRGGRDGGPAWGMDPAAWNYSSTNERNLGQLYHDIGLPYQAWIRTATIGEVAMLDNMRLWFSQWQILVFDRCKNLIAELRTWKHKLDKDGNIDPNDRYTGHNHAIDALKAWSNSGPLHGPNPDDTDDPLGLYTEDQPHPEIKDDPPWAPNTNELDA